MKTNKNKTVDDYRKFLQTLSKFGYMAEEDIEACVQEARTDADEIDRALECKDTTDDKVEYIVSRFARKLNTTIHADEWK